MKQQTVKIIDELTLRYPQLEQCRTYIEETFEILKQCYKKEGKVLICGNGGSTSDSEHIVGELMKGFILERKICKEHVEKLKQAFPEEVEYLSENLQGALPAISLASHSALAYAYINDVAPDMVFAQQVYGYARYGDVLIGLSTSGNSQNVINAIKVAKAFGVKTIGLTGKSGGKMVGLCDVVIKVPELETYKVQELHLPVYHALCAMVEMEFFG
ncbi:MAG TPA: SIS domain-containing protein [Ruminiclostridium sp.]